MLSQELTLFLRAIGLSRSTMASWLDIANEDSPVSVGTVKVLELELNYNK